MVEQGRGEIFTAKSEESVLREAELLALRQMADNVSAMTRELVTNREVMTELRIDMASIKERQAQHSEFKDFLLELKDEQKTMTDRIVAIERRNAQQDGAVGFVQYVKDFGPWLLAIAAALWALVKTRV